MKPGGRQAHSFTALEGVAVLLLLCAHLDHSIQGHREMRFGSLIDVVHYQQQCPCVLLALQAPLAAALLFAAYLATSLLLGVATFRTVPEEAELLQKACGHGTCWAGAGQEACSQGWYQRCNPVLQSCAPSERLARNAL